MNNFNFQDFLAGFQSRRAMYQPTLSNFRFSPRQTETQTVAGNIQSKIQEMLAKIKKPVLEQSKPVTLFPETKDEPPVILQPVEKEPEMFANYGIVCPVDESIDEKWFRRVEMNYGIVCYDDIQEPVKDNPEPETKEIEMYANYGIVCPKDKPHQETRLLDEPMMMMNYGIVCPSDITALNNKTTDDINKMF